MQRLLAGTINCITWRICMPPPAYAGDGDNMRSGGNACDAVCDSVRDNARISETVAAY